MAGVFIRTQHQLIKHEKPFISQKIIDSSDPTLIQLYYDITIKGQNDINLAPTPLIAIVMLFFRMCSFTPLDFDNNHTPRENSAPAPTKKHQCKRHRHHLTVFKTAL